jgi:transposase
VSPRSDEQLQALRQLYRHTKDVRLRTRAQIVLLAVEQAMTASKIAEIVRENDGTVRAWLKRYEAEGIEGLSDRPCPGGPSKLTATFIETLLTAVRKRPRSFDLPFSLWTCQRWLTDKTHPTPPG